jgi:hypothetical protein
MMHFVQPAFLYALFALVIPVIIHLFNFKRYKKVYFTNVRYLENLQQERHKQSRIRQLLILAARILALTFLVLAFAQPFIPDPARTERIAGQKAISIYMDNSYSMEAASGQGKLLEQAKQRAREILEAHRPSDLFQLLTTELAPDQMQFLGQDEVRKWIEEVQYVHTLRQFSHIIRFQADQLHATGKKSLDAYFISDFQQSTTDLDITVKDTSINVFLIPVRSEKSSNLFFDSLWFDTPIHLPGQVSRINARINNTGSESVEKVPVKFSINALQKNAGNLDIKEGSTSDIALSFTENKNGNQLGMIELSDYPVVYDNRFYFAYEIRDLIDIFCVYDKDRSPYLSALFETDTMFHYVEQPVNQIDYAALRQASLIILNGLNEIPSGLLQELNKFLEHGGSILIFPGFHVDVGAYKAFLFRYQISSFGEMDTTRQRVASVNIKSQIYHNVFNEEAMTKGQYDLPFVYRYYQLIQPSRPAEEILMLLEKGDPFLLWSSAGKGRIFLSSVPLDDHASTLPRHLIYVPTLYQIAVQSIPSQKLYYFTDNNEMIPVDAGAIPDDPVFRIKNTETGEEFIPQTQITDGKLRLLPRNHVTRAGWYNIYNGNTLVTSVAFNYNPKESNLKCYSPSQLREMITRMNLTQITVIDPSAQPLTEKIRLMNQGLSLWKWCLIATLFFIICEIILIRTLRK